MKERPATTATQARVALAVSLAFPAMFAALFIWESTRCIGFAPEPPSSNVGLSVRCEDVDVIPPTWITVGYFVTALAHLPALFVFVTASVLPLLRPGALRPKWFPAGVALLTLVEVVAIPYAILSGVVLLDRVTRAMEPLWLPA